MTNGTDETAPWERELAIIAYTRRRSKRATKAVLLEVVGAGLDEATQIVELAARQDWHLPFNYKMQGAVAVVEAMGRRLDRP